MQGCLLIQEKYKGLLLKSMNIFRILCHLSNCMLCAYLKPVKPQRINWAAKICRKCQTDGIYGANLWKADIFQHGSVNIHCKTSNLAHWSLITILPGQQ